MTHAHLPPTYALVRPPSTPDPEEFKREADRVADLLAARVDVLARAEAFLATGWIAS